MPATKWDAIPHKPVSKQGLLSFDYRGFICPTVVQWHLWCDGSFTPAKDPTTETPGLPPKAGWTFVIQAQTSPLVDSAAITCIAAGPLTPAGASASGIHILAPETAESFVIHQAVKWALAATEPVVVHFDCKASGHAAEATSHPTPSHAT